MDLNVLSSIDRFVESTRDVLFLRDSDSLLIIRPNKIQHVNRTALEMLDSLYMKRAGAGDTVKRMSAKYGLTEESLLEDLSGIVSTVGAIMREDYASAHRTRTVRFEPERIALPVLSEIALTYRCQNRCDFCYAGSPYRGRDMREMNTGEVKTVMDRIFDEAQVPAISFTGGEPTLRDDLPELVAYASDKGLRTNLITNGIRCADKDLAAALGGAGLKSAQVSLESQDRDIHNAITGNPASYDKAVRGISNLSALGIHTHTNTTICSKNRDHLIPIARFVREEFGFSYLSMNMIIATGIARDNENIDIGYSAIGAILTPVLKFCEEIGIKFVWYSPTPYCVFNPLDHNLGSKSCACVSGLLSVNPAGDIIPCSSFDRGIGSILKHPFDYIWNSDQALYFREKRYLPPVCGGCDMEKICSGACPLYWENAGGFTELEKIRGKRPAFRNLLWKIERSLRLRTRGIQGLLKKG